MNNLQYLHHVPKKNHLQSIWYFEFFYCIILVWQESWVVRSFDTIYGHSFLNSLGLASYTWFIVFINLERDILNSASCVLAISKFAMFMSILRFFCVFWSIACKYFFCASILICSLFCTCRRTTYQSWFLKRK